MRWPARYGNTECPERDGPELVNLGAGEWPCLRDSSLEKRNPEQNLQEEEE